MYTLVNMHHFWKSHVTAHLQSGTITKTDVINSKVHRIESYFLTSGYEYLFWNLEFFKIYAPNMLLCANIGTKQNILKQFLSKVFK